MVEQEYLPAGTWNVYKSPVTGLVPVYIGVSREAAVAKVRELGRLGYLNAYAEDPIADEEYQFGDDDD